MDEWTLDHWNTKDARSYVRWTKYVIKKYLILCLCGEDKNQQEDQKKAYIGSNAKQVIGIGELK